MLGGLRIDERHPHSVDTYREARYYDFGRDASIEYGYRDLRFTNLLDVPVVLRVKAATDSLEAWLEATSHPPEGVAIEVTPPEFRSKQGVPLIAVRTTHTRPGGLKDDLGWSLYQAPWLKAAG
jgi:vancomycin resistance protein YoaR